MVRFAAQTAQGRVMRKLHMGSGCGLRSQTAPRPPEAGGPLRGPLSVYAFFTAGLPRPQSGRAWCDLLRKPRRGRVMRKLHMDGGGGPLRGPLSVYAFINAGLPRPQSRRAWCDLLRKPRRVV